MRFAGQRVTPTLMALVVALFMVLTAGTTPAAPERGTPQHTAASVVTAPHVEVKYSGVPKTHAAAVANVLSAAREAHAKEFGFALPETIRASVECGPGSASRLFTDGEDRVFLSLPSADRMMRPSKSGTFVLYGLCHELGHVGMYGILKDRDWMTSAAAEGWAHYAGSVVVDRLAAAKGQGLWAIDPYDFSADGTARLDKALAGSAASDVDRAAGLWRDLVGIVGRDEIPELLRAWQAFKPNEQTQQAVAEGLLNAAVRTRPAKGAELEQWWAKAAPLFVHVAAASDFKKAQIDRKRLEGRPLAIAEDDGTSDGKKSIAGGGHARRFVAPPGEWYVASVSVFGSRYGPAQAPAGATFDVALCDADMKPVAAWKHPQSLFSRGEAKWVKVAVPPTRVPPGEGGFYVCVQFRPTATQGVFVHFDSSAKGKRERSSLTATPGDAGEPFAAGDWMIRAEIDRPKSANALGEK